MKTAILALAAITATAAAHEYHFKDGWPTPPEGQQTLGDSHGEIGTDSKGLIYVSVMGGEKPGIQIYSPEGKYLRNLPNARNNHHGFTIISEEDGEFIYAACLKDKKTAFLKLTLTGETALEIPNSAIPKDLIRKDGHGTPYLALTHADRAPDGSIILIDGYSSDRIFVFGPDGTFRTSFGGKAEPWKFNNAHKFAVDHRFDPPRILVCDRNNGRLVHLALDGTVIGDHATNLHRPSALAFHGETLAVAEIAGRVSILGIDGKTIKILGQTPDPALSNTNNTPPEKWQPGLATSPHGITFDKDGNILMSEWNKWGRLLRWDVKL